jgi:hypothetical protein
LETLPADSDSKGCILLVRVLLLVVPVLGLCALSRASDLPVGYVVQEKPLRTSGVAGTSLIFTLYSDAACTNQLYQATVSIQNVELISRLKLVTPRGAVRTAPTDELRTTLPDVMANGNVYLTVTGTGVTPSGSACQPQASAVQLPPGFSHVVKDAHGAVVGSPTDPYGSAGIETVVGGAVGVAPASAQGFLAGAPLLFFSSSDCTGQALLPVTGALIQVLNYRASNATLYAAPTSGGTTVP